MRRYLCRAAGCGVLLASPGYCTAHKWTKEGGTSASGRKPFGGAVRGNEGLYNTSEWRRLRRAALKDNPHCTFCGISRNDAGAPLELHHIIPPRGNETLFFDSGNVQVVCHACHQRLTQREIDSRKQRQRTV
ncbi:MAG: HNH endonuclease [Treponema sp.]|nr:HNH endonuclease [Treponema sp.]